MTEAKTISKERPADISMDYVRLREEGIQHLEELASEIWTDFNAHDPGITILEVLCYAITDIGYRANLPIEDLLKSEPGVQKDSFFKPIEILPNCPVTATDYRKLIIDVEGVKNAWIYKSYSQEPPFIYAANNIQEKPIDSATEDDLCHSAYYPLSIEDIQRNGNGDSLLQLNGLYEILIELDPGIPTTGKRADVVKGLILKRLHANRNLSEDFAAIKILQNCPICICLDLEIEQDSDEIEVMAEVIFRLQSFLAPTPRFKSFQEMKASGLSCEDIFNGPLLDCGFLTDEELENAPLRRKVFKSDLMRVIIETPKVKSIKSFYFKKATDEFFDKSAWCLDIEACGLFQNEDPCIDIYKPYLDVCCSKLRVAKGVLETELIQEDLESQLELLWLLDQGPAIKTTGPEVPKGRFRNDLGDYESIQFEFPQIYGIGDAGLPPNSPPLRKAQVKQLRAYLLFFDQILAAYLKQLTKVKDLLSVEQNPGEATHFFSTLYEVPGMSNLLKDFGVYYISDEKLDVLITDPNLNEAYVKVLEMIKEEPTFERHYTSIATFNEVMQNAFGTSWDIPSLKSMINNAFFEPQDEDAWIDYQNQEDSYFIKQLQSLTEKESKRQLRRNQIMDHLLGRFGEQFSVYVTNLFQTKVAREEDPATQTFPQYLEAKSQFLTELPGLGSERGKGYNYRAKLNTGEVDVWNSNNVAGLKKRVSRYLGIKDYRAQSLICDPDYSIVIHKGETPEGFSTYQLRLLERKSRDVLLTSKTYRRQKKRVEGMKEILHLEVEKKDYYKIEQSGGKSIVVYENSEGEKKLRLESPAMPLSQAEQLLSHILKLVTLPNCEREGFHILEHILLRPNDKDDKPLHISLAQCGEEEGTVNKLKDPYSFWVSILLPGWLPRFKDRNFRKYVEQIFRREAPAHIALRFCWLDLDQMQTFQRSYQLWRIELAKCLPNECNVNTYANELIDFLNNTKCSCTCVPEETGDTFCITSTPSSITTA